MKLPADLDAKLRHEAARRGATIAEVAREAIEAHVGGAARRRLIAAKAGRSGQHDTARRIEEIIRERQRLTSDAGAQGEDPLLNRTA